MEPPNEPKKTGLMEGLDKVPAPARMFSLSLFCLPVVLVIPIWGWAKGKLAVEFCPFWERSWETWLNGWVLPFFIVGEEAMTLLPTALTFGGIWQRKTVGEENYPLWGERREKRT